MERAVFVYTTWPSIVEAEEAGRSLVERQLAACVNILPRMISVYRWKGAIETAQETPMLLKTTRVQAAALKDFLVARHPYETPAVVALDVLADASHGEFLAWVAAETTR